jgi:hypothetical protein
MPELGEQKFSEVNAYYASTGDLTTEARARAASFAVKAADASKVMASGFIDVNVGSNAVATSNRLFGYHSGTGRCIDIDDARAGRRIFRLGRRRRRGLEHDRF